MPRAFRFEPFYGVDGSILLANSGNRIANERDMDLFFKCAEPDLDRLTLELCADERGLGSDIPKWLMDDELNAFIRTRDRVSV